MFPGYASRLLQEMKETYKEKVYELNKERVKNKNENEKIKKLK